MLRPIRRLIGATLKDHLDKVLNLYPPYLGAGVRLTEVGDDYRHIRVEMPLRWYNRNYVGTHFGGSLYSMCDPFYMLMLVKNLGPDYIVWDKAASIRFRKPGRGTVHAIFILPEDRLQEIRRAADADGKTEPEFTAEVRDRHGDVVAELHKTIYVRRKA